MSHRPVVAIDPGGRETGLVALDADSQLIDWKVEVRKGDQDLPDFAYLTLVLTEARRMMDLFDERPVVAVEGLVKPTPQMGMTGVMGLVGTGMVFGGVLARFHAIVVRPGGHGKNDLRFYPEPIRPTRGKGVGDIRRHARSAFDIALVGRRQALIEAAAA